MITPKITESTVEKSIVTSLQLRHAVKHGPEIAPGELLDEETDHGQVALSDRLGARRCPKLISAEPQVPDGVRTWGKNA